MSECQQTDGQNKQDAAVKNPQEKFKGGGGQDIKRRREVGCTGKEREE